MAALLRAAAALLLVGHATAFVAPSLSCDDFGGARRVNQVRQGHSAVLLRRANAVERRNAHTVGQKPHTRAAVAIRASAAATAPATTGASGAWGAAPESGTAAVYDREALAARFAARPLEVAARVARVMAALARVKLAGDSDGGQTLRNELAALGPVFCKVGQTLATRPDIIGADISRQLGQLQDAMAPEPDASAAFDTLRASLRACGFAPATAGGDVVDAVFRTISKEPVAAASLAEVYRATTHDGRAVAVKIQRRCPGPCLLTRTHAHTHTHTHARTHTSDYNIHVDMQYRDRWIDR